MKAAIRNTWTPREAADWAGITYRQLLDLLASGALPGIRIGQPHIQKMPGGALHRRRRAGKWLIPRESFQTAWRSFVPQNREKEYEAR
jgi:hypothetical protein